MPVTAEFDLQPDLIYLNHAAVSPWPRRTVEAVQRFAAENGSLGSRHYPRWLGTEQRLRERLAALIGARSPGEIALAKSTSEALSMVAQGLSWADGDNVVGIAQEFPSNRIVWEALADRGVRWRSLDLNASSDPEADLMRLCDERTRVLAVSWVQYARGLRLDLERLGGACRARGIVFCVDGIQGVGALPLDVGRAQADVVVADGHKWMLGPEGLALFWCRPELREQLRLTQFGWHMVEDMGDFDRKDWRPAADARRFECGSPNLLGAHALEASLSLLQEVGMPAVAEAIGERTARLIELIDTHGLELLSRRDVDRRAGIVTFRVPGVDQQVLYKALMEQNLMCASRGGGLRFSPHFYTAEEQLERAVALTLDLAASIAT
jgi:selenocysteine lyase/cysteine desulfurase